jgi:O-antigen chain-terminating methyltransferase
MSANDRDRLEREQREADARYNDALTALDRAVVETNGRPLSREDFDRVATAVIVFLQQITAFVDTRDRAVAGAASARVSRLEGAVETVAEIRGQVAFLQRAVQKLMRERQPAAGASPPPAVASDDDVKYVAFEDQFRGDEESIRERVRGYVPLFAGAGSSRSTGRNVVVDLGCGRGELLAALREADIRATGVDVNGEMVAVARERGLDAVQGDALGYLQSVADDSLGGVIATQVVEHLQPSYLVRLLDVAARKLRHGAPIVLETINAACWLAFFSSYVRDITHVRPIHPDTLQYLLRASGFERVTIQYSAPVADSVKMKTIDMPADIRSSQDPTAVALSRIAHTINANAVVLNNLMFTHLDYAAIGYRA